MALLDRLYEYLTPDEMAVCERLESIDAVPADVLPRESEARALLVELAELGHDVYCYHAAGGPSAPWNVWLEDDVGRLTIAEFVARYEECYPNERFPARLRDHRRQRPDPAP